MFIFRARGFIEKDCDGIIGGSLWKRVCVQNCRYIGSAQPFRGALFVWFSDDRRIEVVVRFGVALFVLGIIIIIVVVGVSRGHSHGGDGTEGNVPRDARGHIGLPSDVTDGY